MGCYLHEVYFQIDTDMLFKLQKAVLIPFRLHEYLKKEMFIYLYAYLKL